MANASAQQVIVELIRQAGGQWEGRTKLFKAFYFAHLFFAEDQPGILTEWPIVRTPQGPGIHKSQALFDPLETEGLLAIQTYRHGPYPECRYTLTAKGMESSKPSDEAGRAVQKAVEFVKPRTAAELSSFAQEYSRAWIDGKDGAILDIYIDLIPDHEFDREQAKLAELDRQLVSVLSKQDILRTREPIA